MLDHASDNTFPHGLTQAPDFYIIKCLDVGAEQWRVYHKSSVEQTMH